MSDLSALMLGNESDPYRSPAARDWKIVDGSRLESDLELEADVVIIGTGAGGGTAAEVLAQAGLEVVLLEAGPLKTSSEFDLEERAAYRDLYQEGTGRATKDGAITILQGRSVGGSTTVNWTSSFRTPEPTLRYWAEQLGVAGCGVEELAPHFAHMEQRLGIAEWQGAPNANNDLLRRAAEALGYSWKRIPRNVRGCHNLGYCGMGCPVDAKQSMLVTTIPSALGRGARLVHRAQVERLLLRGDGVEGVEALALDGAARTPTGHKITVRARTVVLAGGGIQTPAVMLRSGIPDPHGRVGKRTFLHPVTLSMAVFDEQVDPFYGAPQSIYSDHFQWQQVSGPVGFKLEVPPLHPGFTAGFYGAVGEDLTRGMDRLVHTHCMIALLRDGFHERSVGGAVELNDEGRPLLDYPLDDYLLEGLARAWRTMVEMQFAAGAREVRPAHRHARPYGSWKEAKREMVALDMKPFMSVVGSAHVMGGAAMGEDARTSVVDGRGRHHHVEGLHVMDGSLFPTSIGANPQLSIYGLVHKLATGLAEELAS